MFFSIGKDYFNPAVGAFQPAKGLTGGVSTKGTFFEAASIFQDLKLEFDTRTKGALKIVTLTLTPRTGNALSPASIFLLCLTRTELNDLIAVGGFNNTYPRYLVLKKRR